MPRVNWRGIVLASALLLSACGGSASSTSPQTKAERAVRQLATRQSVSLSSVRCSRLSRNGYGCIGKTKSGGTYTCSIGIFAKGGAEGACFLTPRS
jgi:hypothetical protein